MNKIGREITKKIGKITLWVLAILFALNISIVLLLFVPPVQKMVVNTVTTLLSNKLGSDLYIEKIYLSPFFELKAENIIIKDYKDSVMIAVPELSGKVSFANLKLNIITLKELKANGTQVLLRKYKGEERVNIAVWADGLKSDKKEKSKIKIIFDKLLFTNGRFLIEIQDSRTDTYPNEIDFAYFELTNINVDADNFTILGDHIVAGAINSISLDQYSGFNLKKMAGNFHLNDHEIVFDNAILQLDHSELRMDLAMKYKNGFTDFSNVLDSVRFVADIEKGRFNTKDVACFAPKIKGMENSVDFKGWVDGPVNALHLKEFYLENGLETAISGDFFIENITNIAQSAYKADIENLHVSFHDLSNFTLPKGKKLPLPKIVTDLQSVSLNGYYNGSLTDFNSDLHLHTILGSVDLTMESKTVESDLHFAANVQSNSVNIGKLLNQPFMKSLSLNVNLDGKAQYDSTIMTLISTLRTQIAGSINHWNLFDRNLDEIVLKGTYADSKYTGTIASLDTNLCFNFDGIIDFSNKLPNFQSQLSIKNIAPYPLVAQYKKKIDTLNAKGIDKVILMLQKNSSFAFSMDNLNLNVFGSDLNNFNGYFVIDGLNLLDSNRNVRTDRISLSTQSHPLQGISLLLQSNFLNTSLKTNYKFSHLADSLKNIASYYLPRFFNNEIANVQNVLKHDTTDHYLDLYFETYASKDILELLISGVSISPKSKISLHLGADRAEDSLYLNIPNFELENKFKVDNIKIVTTPISSDVLSLDLDVKSFGFYQKKGDPIDIRAISLDLLSSYQKIKYDLSWINPLLVSDVNEKSYLKGLLDGSDFNNLRLTIDSSLIWLKDMMWNFNNSNSIVLKKDGIDINNCVISSEQTEIELDGTYSTKAERNLNVSVTNVDIDLVNTILQSDNISFDGILDALFVLKSSEKTRTLEGDCFISDFIFNDESLGDLYLAAEAPAGESPTFTGTLFVSDTLQRSNLIHNMDEQQIIDYFKQRKKAAIFNGKFQAEEKSLRVYAGINEINIGFLSPFLSSFSDQISGKAEGDLGFTLTKDSLYFSGEVNVISGSLGIAPLGTTYYLKDQKIGFDQDGFNFGTMTLLDQYNNKATMTGYVHHQAFKNFDINLAIQTDRLQVLNMPKSYDTYFYGSGLVAGNVTIIGDNSKLEFFSNNLKTLRGTHVYLPITSATSASQMNDIYFIPPRSTEDEKKEINSSSMALIFDFIFDINRDADLSLDLDVIDGKLDCKSDGKLRLYLNTSQGDLNLTGMLKILNGNFDISLKNFVPRQFQLVEGGTITFNGPIDAAALAISAKYEKKMSVKNINEDLNIGKTLVESYINLAGGLMNPQPGFSFAFPNLTRDEERQLFAALDTTDTQSTLRQFFSVVFLNTFISKTSSAANLGSQSLDLGLEMLTNMFNTYISQQIKGVDIGIDVFSEDESQYKEYSVNASIPIYDDRIIVQTSLGYAQQGGAGGDGSKPSGFVGDVSVEVLINEAGNWRFKVFYANDQYDPNREASRPTQRGGVAIIFQQQFNSRKDLIESWKKTRMGKNKKKNKKKETN